MKMTAEDLHTEIIQTQVVPRETPEHYKEKKVFVWITPHCRLERYLLYMKDPIQDAYTSTLSIISRHMKITIQRVIGLRIGNLRELKQTMWQNHSRRIIRVSQGYENGKEVAGHDQRGICNQDQGRD